MKRNKSDLCKKSENADDKQVTTNKGKYCLFRLEYDGYSFSVGRLPYKVFTLIANKSL